MRPILPCLIAAASVAAASLLIAATPAPAPTPAPVINNADLRQSITRSLALLDKAEVGFARQATCSSCHSQVDPMVAAKLVRDRGMTINEAAFKSQLASTVETLNLRHDYMLQLQTPGGTNVVVGAMMTGLAEVDYPANADTDAGAVYMIKRQMPSGAWPSAGIRSPTGESGFDVTARAIRSIDAYAPPALRKQADAAIARGRRWLVTTRPSDDNMAYAQRLQGLIWAKAAPREIDLAKAQLSARQNADGGWSQKPGMASDAFAAGGNLMVLARAGMKTTDPVYQRGLDYLLRTQKADGSWYVKSRALPIQPPIDSGFPYGPDQWIASWATAYAVTAMAYAL